MLGSQDSNSWLKQQRNDSTQDSKSKLKTQNSRLKIQTQDSNSRLKIQTQDSNSRLSSRLKLMTQERIFSIIINQTKKRQEQSMVGVSGYVADMPHAWRHSLRIKSCAQAAGNVQGLLARNMHNLFGLCLMYKWTDAIHFHRLSLKTMMTTIMHKFIPIE